MFFFLPLTRFSYFFALTRFVLFFCSYTICWLYLCSYKGKLVMLKYVFGSFMFNSQYIYIDTDISSFDILIFHVEKQINITCLHLSLMTSLLASHIERIETFWGRFIQATRTWVLFCHDTIVK